MSRKSVIYIVQYKEISKIENVTEKSLWNSKRRHKKLLMKSPLRIILVYIYLTNISMFILE